MTDALNTVLTLAIWFLGAWVAMMVCIGTFELSSGQGYWRG